jgi:alpha-glucosidase
LPFNASSLFAGGTRKSFRLAARWIKINLRSAIRCTSGGNFREKRPLNTFSVPVPELVFDNPIALDPANGMFDADLRNGLVRCFLFGGQCLSPRFLLRLDDRHAFQLLFPGCGQRSDRAPTSENVATAAAPSVALGLPEDSLAIRSPDNEIEVRFGLIWGVPYYRVSKDEVNIILPSKMGFIFLHDAPLNDGLTIVNAEQTTFDETWTQPWGEVKNIRDHHNELQVLLTNGGTEPRELVIVFRVFDDGVGFRYEFPEQPHLNEFQIMDELTEFSMTGDHVSWWIPAYGEDRYEYLYENTTLSRIPPIAPRRVHTPFTMQTDDGLFLSIHEAALIDYSSMALIGNESLTLEVDLFPWSDGVKVKGSAPLKTPWRTIQIAENAGDLITSYLILNLNEPNALGDVSWVQPGKYIGIWWGMHIGKWTWGSGPNHGATNENARAYLDFAGKYDFSGELIEGWNLGWDGDWMANGDQFDFTTPHPDFDLEGLAAYAKEQGTRLIGHHETGAAFPNYESQMEMLLPCIKVWELTPLKPGMSAGDRASNALTNRAALRVWNGIMASIWSNTTSASSSLQCVTAL